jgi:hypothetical protein
MLKCVSNTIIPLIWVEWRVFKPFVKGDVAKEVLDMLDFQLLSKCGL